MVSTGLLDTLPCCPAPGVPAQPCSSSEGCELLEATPSVSPLCCPFASPKLSCDCLSIHWSFFQKLEKAGRPHALWVHLPCGLAMQQVLVLDGVFVSSRIYMKKLYSPVQ